MGQRPGPLERAVNRKPQRILVTGHLGYIGTVLVPMLLDRGHDVTGLDTDLYRGCTYGSRDSIIRIPSIEMDVRDVESDMLSDFDSVVHLAALSNDPLGDMDPALTDDLNHVAAVRLAERARSAGVRRFIFSSTCSNYGASDDGMLTEDSPFNPVTPYGVAKVKAEAGIRSLASREFSPTILRSGTACGLSPRIRFDLVLNNLTAWAMASGRVHLKSDGAAWRPIVHVRDISKAFVAVLEAECDRIHDRAFNVGRTDQNFRVREIARTVHEAVPGSQIAFGEGAGADIRNYRVDCDRIVRELPEYEPTWTLERSAAELRNAMVAAPVPVDDFEGPRFQRLGHIRMLVDRKELMPSLRRRRGASKSFAIRSSRAKCHGCESSGLRPILNLGDMPASDGLIPCDAPPEFEQRKPLEVGWCPECTLVQILEHRPREVLFGEDYPYFASYSRDLMDHGRRNAERLTERLGLDDSSLVVEPASNDGSLLANFVERGIRVLGVDPAPRQVQASIDRGVPALQAFFDADTASRIHAEQGPADLIIANNVLAHVTDLKGFIRGIDIMLGENAVASLEFPWLADLLAHTEFDTIYHEHLCYWSLGSVMPVLEKHGLRVLDAEHLEIHGGSLRLTVGRHGRRSEELDRLIERERIEGVGSLPALTCFANRVSDLTAAIRELLEERRGQGRRIAAYGAAAKGTMLLNALEADTTLIDGVYDRNPHKHGRLIPGVRIPVLPADALRENPPDDLLILPWNFKDEIMEQESVFHESGGRFIVPIPEPMVI